MKPTKILTIACLIIGILIGGIGIISDLVSLPTAIYSEVTGLIFVVIIDLCFEAALLTFSIIYLIRETTKGEDHVNATSSVISLYFSGAALSSIVLLFYLPSDVMGVYIAIMLFFCIAAILLALGGSLFKKSPKTGAIISLVGFFMSFILVLLALFGVGTSGSTTLTIFVEVMVLIYIILGIVLFILYLKRGENYILPNMTSNTSLQSRPVEKDAVEQLRQLKNLHEQGILNDEEYEEKKKKYIDKL